MKKATNSKNRGKISKLFPVMQEHLGKLMNLVRIKLIALLPRRSRGSVYAPHVATPATSAVPSVANAAAGSPASITPQSCD